MPIQWSVYIMVSIHYTLQSGHLCTFICKNLLNSETLVVSQFWYVESKSARRQAIWACQHAKMAMPIFERGKFDRKIKMCCENQILVNKHSFLMFFWDKEPIGTLNFGPNPSHGQLSTTPISGHGNLDQKLKMLSTSE